MCLQDPLTLTPALPPTHIKERSCDDIMNRLLSANQEQSSTETDYADTLILNFQTQNYEKPNFCCLSYTIYSILVWQPELTFTCGIKSRILTVT